MNSLEKLENLKTQLKLRRNWDETTIDIDEDCKEIEKDLKAFEIIKNKEIDVQYFKCALKEQKRIGRPNDKEIIDTINASKKYYKKPEEMYINQKDFDLLKERL